MGGFAPSLEDARTRLIDSLPRSMSGAVVSGKFGLHCRLMLLLGLTDQFILLYLAVRNEQGMVSYLFPHHDACTGCLRIWGYSCRRNVRLSGAALLRCLVMIINCVVRGGWLSLHQMC